jgi:hypothetical protein
MRLHELTTAMHDYELAPLVGPGCRPGWPAGWVDLGPLQSGMGWNSLTPPAIYTVLHLHGGIEWLM